LRKLLWLEKYQLEVFSLIFNQIIMFIRPIANIFKVKLIGLTARSNEWNYYGLLMLMLYMC